LHQQVSERDFNGGSRPFVARVLRAFTAEQARAWLESLGIALKLEPTGKYFPVSDDAQTVLDALLGAVWRAGVSLEIGARVVRIEKGPPFRLGIQEIRDSAALGAGVAAYGGSRWEPPAVGPSRWIEADAVVLANGGLSFPRTGSDGTGYALAASLGHTIVPPTPALTPLAADDPLCKSAQGLALDAELTLWVARKRAVSVRGSLLFTHFGYSGPVALDLSRHWLRAEGEKHVTANVLPGQNQQGVDHDWVRVAAKEPRLSVRRHLDAQIPDRLVVELCGEAAVDPSAPLSQVDRAARRRLIERLVARELPITGTLGYEKAEVTAGGVELSEVNPSTLESRRCPGLFLCGEVLDVEGRLGGFNFQWAWSSGTVAGRAAAST